MKFFLCVCFCLTTAAAFAQDTTSFLSKGHLYGVMFGDYFYKSQADSLERGQYQYSRLKPGSNAFQIRRIQLGYQYDISPQFTADILVESVADNGSMNFFIKYANLKWEGIFPGANLTIGRIKTPTFATNVDKIWSYRSVERTITDMHGHPSFDLGIALGGRFDKAGKFGYYVMVGNGEGSSVTDNRFKKFYGEVYTKLADERLLLDVYADYERLHWQQGFHQSTNMLKAFAAYQWPDLTIGVEAYTQYLQQGVVRRKEGIADTVSTRNFAWSAFVRGKLFTEKLQFFVRMDRFNPFTRVSKGTTALTTLIDAYDPANLNGFITAGIDYSPVKDVHFIPNVWYSGYKGLLAGQKDGDLVYRLTFCYQFGK